ncbi:MAG: flavin reductase family protein [Bacteroidota bacterium]
MVKEFVKVDPKQLTENIFKIMDEEWFLITAGNSDGFNMMTASWGGVGSLWHKMVTFTFVRPQRHTYQFMEKGDFYTLSFFGEKCREELKLCGSRSGKQIDKVKETGLTPALTDNNAVYFQEARLVIECKKMYAGPILESGFVVPEIPAEVYPTKDFHKMYIGEIVNVFTKE